MNVFIRYLFSCVIAFSFSVSAFGQVTASFYANPAQGCNSFTVDFTNTSYGTGTLTYLWDFGNQNSSILQNPTGINYLTPGIYTVILTVTNGIDTDTFTSNIVVFQDPVANFAGVAPLLGCVPLTVSFNDLSVAGNGNIIQWVWDFGDGGTSTNQNPSHTYLLTGSYSVSLQVTDINGCNNDIVFQNYINVSSPPVINFTADVTTYCSVPFTVNFTNNTTGTGTITYLWLFGDGSDTTVANPTHTYTVPGIYDVSLTATDQYGCQSTLVDSNYISITIVVPAFHTVPADSVCPGDSVQFFNDAGTTALWDFGDGTPTSTDNNPIHVYSQPGNYIITFVAAPGTICDSLIQDTINVRLRPVASFSASTHYVCSAAMPVTFTDTSPDAVNWNWVINGAIPSTSTNQNTTVIYPIEGSYSATLTITDSYGCISLPYTDTVIVDFPNPGFYFTPSEGCIPLTVTFTDGSTVNIADAITNYTWDFGDATPISNLQNPVHVYNDTGTFNITLTITTLAGCTDSVTYSVQAGEHHTPVISFTYTGGCANDTSIYFESNFIPASDSVYIDTYDWSFTNVYNETVGSSNVGDPYIDFHGNDTIDIRLIVNQNGCRDTLDSAAAFYLNGPYFTGIDTIFSCTNPLHVGAFIPFMREAIRWYWDMNNDGTIDDSSHYILPTTVNGDTAWFDYPSRGTYTIHLIAYNDSTGCYYEDSLKFRLFDILADITVTSPNCPNNVVFDLSGSFDWENPSYPSANDTINYGDGQIIPYNYFTDSISHNYPQVSAQYSVILTMQNFLGCRDTAIIPLRIFQPVAGYTLSPDSGCVPFTVFFSDTSHADTTIAYYYWSYGTGATDTTDTGSVYYTYLTPGTVPYYVTLTIADVIGCISTISNQFVTVPPFIANFVALDNTICKGDSVYFTNTTVGIDTISYMWYFGDGDSSNVINPVHLYPDSGNYSVILTAQSPLPGCFDTISIYDFIQIQTITTDFTVLDAHLPCYPDTIHITNLTDTIYNPLWNWSFGDGTYAIQQTPFHNYTSPGNFLLTLIATTPFGCSDTDSVMIQIDGPPITEILLSDSIICKGDTVTFSLVNPIGVTNYSWDFGDGSTGNTASVSHVYNYVPLNGFFYPSLIYCNDSGCCGPPQSDIIRIFQVMANFSYINSVTGSNDTAICGQGSLNFQNISFGANSNIWYFGDGQNFTGQTPGTHTYYNTTNNDTTYYISLVIYNSEAGCVDSITKPYIVYHLPQITVGNDAAICSGSSIQLNASGGIAVIWAPVQDLSNPNDSMPFASPDSSIWYHATIYDEHICSNSDSVHIVVQQSPQLTHSPDTSIIIGELVNMMANSDQSTVTYQWSPAYGLSCTDCVNPIAQPLQTTTYTVEIVDTMNCFHVTGQVTIEVIDEYTIDVPSAFTPDGDGINDFIFVKGWGIKQLLEFKIYNRWGQCIFSTDDIHKGWDGTFKGIIQNIDTYAYTAKVEAYSGRQFTKNGLINLLR